jgi:hypothetical protein
MIEKMNEHLRTIGSKYSTDDGINFRTIIPSSEKIVILTKRFQTIEEASAYIFGLKATN